MTPDTAPPHSAAVPDPADVEKAARAMCQTEHPELQATLIPLHDTGDSRDEVAACYACQRLAVAALAAINPGAERSGR